MTYEEHKTAVAEAAMSMFKAELDARYPDNVEIAVQIKCRENRRSGVCYVPGPVCATVCDESLGREVASDKYAEVTKKVMDAAKTFCEALTAAAANGYAFEVARYVEGANKPVIFVSPATSTVMRW